MSYIYDVRGKPFGSKLLRDSPVDYKAPLTGSCTVLLTVGDMYATDNLGLILLLWRPNV